jgi:hypothetical protein
MLLLDLDEAQKQIQDLQSRLHEVEDQFEEVFSKKKKLDKKYLQVLS